MKFHKKRYQKIRKGKLKKFEFKANSLNFGSIALKSTQSGILNNKQIEAARKILTKKTNRKAKIWLKLSFSLPITAKPIGTRMGKGKGKISNWAAKIKAGSIIFEIAGYNKKIISNALKYCKFKLPVKTKIFYYYLGLIK